jgi:hypothetical protein
MGREELGILGWTESSGGFCGLPVFRSSAGKGATAVVVKIKIYLVDLPIAHPGSAGSELSAIFIHPLVLIVELIVLCFGVLLVLFATLASSCPEGE